MTCDLENQKKNSICRELVAVPYLLPDRPSLKTEINPIVTMQTPGFMNAFYDDRRPQLDSNWQTRLTVRKETTQKPNVWKKELKLIILIVHTESPEKSVKKERRKKKKKRVMSSREWRTVERGK